MNRSTGIDARGTLLLAVWLGLVTAYLELAVVGWRKFGEGWRVGVGADVVWMAPIVQVAVFVAAGLLIVLIGRVRPRLVTTGRAVFLLSLLSFASLTLLYPRAHKTALLLLAAGMAVQAARVAAPRWDRCRRAVRRTLPVLVLLAVASGVAVRGGRWLMEQRRLAELPAARPGAPNVLLLILDTVRAASLSLYGYDRPTTPNLERWAQRGVVFERAIAPAPWTLPSHASMFTGQWHHALSVSWETPLDDTYPTLAEVMARHGYATGGFVANMPYTSYESGLDRGFIRYEDYPVSLGQLALSISVGRALATSTAVREAIGHHDVLNRKDAGELNGDFLSWLDGIGDRPFFAFLNYFDAHEPYFPPPPFDEMFGPRGSIGEIRHKPNEAWRADRWRLSPEDVAGERNAYEGAIAYLDHEVGRLLEELEARGVLRNTIVIIASDHGEQFGEHGLYDHGNSLYMPLVHVPLMILHPALAGRRIADAVSLRDIPATVLDLAGIVEPGTFPGASLARYWRPGLVARAVGPVLSEVTLLGKLRIKGSRPTGRAVSVVSGDHHYIRNPDGSEELYDYRRDPGEVVNLARGRGGEALLARLRRQAEVPEVHANRERTTQSDTAVAML